MLADDFGAEGDGAEGEGKRTVVPLLLVADKAEPLAAGALLKIVLIVAGKVGLKAEDLDEGAGGLAEAEPRLDDLGVVVNEQCSGGQEVGYLAEGVLADEALAIDKELRLVALRHGIACYALGGQLIGIVGNMDVLWRQEKGESLGFANCWLKIIAKPGGTWQ